MEAGLLAWRGKVRIEQDTKCQILTYLGHTLLFKAGQDAGFGFRGRIP